MMYATPIFLYVPAFSVCVASEETKVGSVVDELEELEKQQERLSKVCS